MSILLRTRLVAKHLHSSASIANIAEDSVASTVISLLPVDFLVFESFDEALRLGICRVHTVSCRFASRAERVL